MNIQSARYSPVNMPGCEERCPLAKFIEYAFENEMLRFMQFIAIQLYEIELDLQSTLIKIEKFISVGIFSYPKLNERIKNTVSIPGKMEYCIELNFVIANG